MQVNFVEDRFATDQSISPGTRATSSRGLRAIPRERAKCARFVGWDESKWTLDVVRIGEAFESKRESKSRAESLSLWKIVVLFGFDPSRPSHAFRHPDKLP